MQAVERYRKVFGPLEHNVTIGGVEFVFVDAQALDGKDHLLCPHPSFELYKQDLHLIAFYRLNELCLHFQIKHYIL